MTERIVAAAIRREGVVFTGAHHHQIIRYACVTLGIPTMAGEQGFMTSRGEFVSREEAANIACRVGQITHEQHKQFPLDHLFSEQLWTLPDWRPEDIR